MTTIQTNSSPPGEISRREAFRFWLKLGFISFGGPAGQIAIMHRELVELRRWVSEKRFLHALNYCMVLPGPEAQQLATYLGWLMHGTVGGVVAGALFVLPSLAILIALSWLYLNYGDLAAVKAIFYGIKPAIVAIVLHAAWRIGGRALNSAALVAIAVASFIAIFFFDAPFPAIIAVAALAGWLGGRHLPAAFAAFKLDKSAPSANSVAIHAVIDDDTPPPAHARRNVPRLVRITLICVGLWGIALVGLALHSGWSSTLTQMGWFFTKAALLTFGGAYAVLPYVVQGAVEQYGWLSTTQMMDGLALGETTPGPLIMVVAFVGYLGGATADAATHNVTFGIIAASVATFFTFLPSFLFILVGAPLIEATRKNIALTAPLSAITAAVVGVIVNLAFFFALYAWWPKFEKSNIDGGFRAFLAGTPLDWLALLISAIAFLLLTRFQWRVQSVIAAAACAGLMTLW
jgi:chromate transporter